MQNAALTATLAEAEMLLPVLQRLAKPVKFTDLWKTLQGLENCPKKPTAQTWLAQLVGDGQVRSQLEGKTLIYWLPTAEAPAKDRICNMLTGAPRAASAVNKDLPKLLPGWPKLLLPQFIAELLQEGRLRQWPALSGKTPLLGLPDANPQFYLQAPLEKLRQKFEKELNKQIDTLAKKLAPAGIGKAQLRQMAEQLWCAQFIGAADAAPDKPAEASPPNYAELILATIPQVDAAAARGGIVSLTSLRAKLTAQLPDKAVFDQTVLALARAVRDSASARLPGGLESGGVRGVGAGRARQSFHWHSLQPIRSRHAMTSPLLTLENPFRNVIVNDPWQFLATDVPTIHQAAFAKCRAALEQVRKSQQTTSVLIYGEAGSGKTHLLSRLWASVVEDAHRDGPGGLEEAVFVPMRLQANAFNIWRFLRRQFANALLRDAGGGQTQLERLLLHRILPWLNLPIAEAAPWLRKQQQSVVGPTTLEQHLDTLFGQINQAGQLDYSLRKVLTRLLQRRKYSEAADWLRGDSLPQEVLDSLGVVDDSEDDPEKLACRIVLGLASLATSELPIIFCFDQVEALQIHPQDFDGLFAFGRMAEELYSGTRNCLLISCLQSAFLDVLHKHIRAADWARLTAFGQVTIDPLNEEQAWSLVQARLNTSPELQALRSSSTNPLWPLEEFAIKPIFTATGVVARSLLKHCDNLFEAARVGQAVPVVSALTTTDALQQIWEQRKEKALAHSLTKESQEILQDGLPRLLALAQPDWKSAATPPTRDVEVTFVKNAKRVGVSLCNAESPKSLSAKLKRLTGQQKLYDELLILRDQRLPLKNTWSVTQDYRKTLLSSGAQWNEPSPECLAALDALRRLLANAQSGDVVNGYETLTEQSVREWLLANLAQELGGIIQEILPQGSTTALEEMKLREQLADLLQRQYVVRLADAAALFDQEPDAVADCALNYPERFGVLGQPPIAVFELVN